MKKITATILCIMILLFGFMNVFANELLPAVVDNAAFLSESEVLSLTGKFDNIRYKYSMDVAVVTISSLGDKSCEQFADDYYDYEGYGFGKDKDGILLVVSENPRNYHFTTTAKGIRVFNDAAIDYLKENVEKYLRNDDYFGAFSEFAEISEEILESDAQGKTFKADVSSKTKRTGLAAALGIPAVIAFIIVLVCYLRMNDAVSKPAANEYTKNNINITKRQDIYLYRTVRKSAKPDSNSSSTHRSSSGTTHGGGGGSY